MWIRAKTWSNIGEISFRRKKLLWTVNVLNLFDFISDVIRFPGERSEDYSDTALEFGKAEFIFFAAQNCERYKFSTLRPKYCSTIGLINLIVQKSLGRSWLTMSKIFGSENFFVVPPYKQSSKLSPTVPKTFGCRKFFAAKKYTKKNSRTSNFEKVSRPLSHFLETELLAWFTIAIWSMEW